MGHMHPVSIVNSASDREFFVCTWHTRVCEWSRYDEYLWYIFTPHACIPNYMQPMHFVPQLATGINHSQPLLTTYCAFGSLLAVISMHQVVECMTRIWSVAMAYWCPICIEGIVYVPEVYWTSVGHCYRRYSCCSMGMVLGVLWFGMKIW